AHSPTRLDPRSSGGGVCMHGSRISGNSGAAHGVYPQFRCKYARNVSKSLEWHFKRGQFGTLGPGKRPTSQSSGFAQDAISGRWRNHEYRERNQNMGSEAERDSGSGTYRRKEPEPRADFYPHDDGFTIGFTPGSEVESIDIGERGVTIRYFDKRVECFHKYPSWTYTLAHS